MDQATRAKSPSRAVASLQDCIVDIDHVAIAVADLDEALDWYVDKLGFRVVEERVTRGKRTSMRSAVLEAGGATVVLVQGLQPDCQVSRFVTEFGPGVQHLAFSVKKLTDAVEKVIAAGGAIDTPVMEEEGIRQVFLRRDPGSAVRVELIERAGGTFSDRSVERLFLAWEHNDLY